VEKDEGQVCIEGIKSATFVGVSLIFNTRPLRQQRDKRSSIGPEIV
jgi:hypothetical protein